MRTVVAGPPLDGDRLDARDPALIAALEPALSRLCRSYFRLRVDGLEHVPRTPALFVANHNGGILGPDLPCTLSTLWGRLGIDAPLYGLAHDFAMRQLAPLGRLLQRFGAVRASVDNARRIFEAGGSALVYPGGDLDAYRHFRRRDEVVLGARTGFVRVAQQGGVPIVPIVAHGAHRSAVIFSEGEALARALRLPQWARLERFPLALSLPWGLAIGPWTPHLPLPFPIRLRVLPPIALDAAHDPIEARELVRARMQAALDAMAVEAR
ncbi:MAG: lysophospholipid acyltransferase family protein [Polyangiales bacterium]